MPSRHRDAGWATSARHLAVFVLALLAALLAIALAAPHADARSDKPALPAPEVIESLIKREIEAFRVAMQSGDFKTLYAHGSKAFRDTVKLEDVDKSLRPMVGAFEPLAVVAPLKPTFTEPPRIDDNGTLVLRGRFEGPGRIVTFTIDMVEDKGEWRFVNLNVKHDTPAQTATPVVPVPEDQRLPMPPPEKIEDMLRSHLALFGKATKTGDFAELRARGARAVQEKSTADEMSAAMAPLRGKFDTLEGIGGLQPVYLEPPAIDGNGRLLLRGYFDTKPLKSIFKLDMVPEDGEWRFEDINVSVNERAPAALPPAGTIESLIKREVEAFRVAMQSGDFKTLHAHGSKAFRDTINVVDIEKSLKPLVGAFEPLALVKPLSPTFSEPPRVDDNGTLILRGTFDAGERIITFTIDMVQDEGQWRYLNLNVKHDTPPSNAPPVVVAQDQRLPLPAPAVIEELLRANVKLFGDAMQSGNFEELHAKGSRPAREATTVEQMRTNMQPLVGRFGALDTLAGVAPQYAEPPRIDDNGLMQLSGHFDAPGGGKVSFNVALMPEDGVWRYETIRVNID